MLSVYDSIIFLLFQDKLPQTVKESLKEEGQCLGELYIDWQALPKGRVPVRIKINIMLELMETSSLF